MCFKKSGLIQAFSWKNEARYQTLDWSMTELTSLQNDVFSLLRTANIERVFHFFIFFSSRNEEASCATSARLFQELFSSDFSCSQLLQNNEGGRFWRGHNYCILLTHYSLHPHKNYTVIREESTNSLSFFSLSLSLSLSASHQQKIAVMRKTLLTSFSSFLKQVSYLHNRSFVF